MRSMSLAALIVLGACADNASLPGGPGAWSPSADGGAGDAPSQTPGGDDAGGGGGGDPTTKPDAETSPPPPEGGAGPVAPEAGASSCAGLALCDGFEGDAPGTAPAGWSIVMGCNPNTQDTMVDGGGLLVGVDDSQHHGGQRSLRVVGGDSCGYYAVQTSAPSKVGPDLYARFWVRFSGSPTQNHNGFLSMATTAGDHLRLGFQDQVIAWNAQTSDATLPDMDPQGTTLSAATQPATWTCVEFHLDESLGHVELWLDGQPVTGLAYDGTVTQGVDDQWSRGAPSPLAPTSLGLGWLGLNDEQTVWFDDVALGAARIGCQ